MDSSIPLFNGACEKYEKITKENYEKIKEKYKYNVFPDIEDLHTILSSALKDSDEFKDTQKICSVCDAFVYKGDILSHEKQYRHIIKWRALKGEKLLQ